jgi:hypothetical protein
LYNFLYFFINLASLVSGSLPKLPGAKRITLSKGVRV